MSYKAKLLTFIFSVSLFLIILLAFAFQFINSLTVGNTTSSSSENRLFYRSLHFSGSALNRFSMDKQFGTIDREFIQKIWDAMDFEHWTEVQGYLKISGAPIVLRFNQGIDTYYLGPDGVAIYTSSISKEDLRRDDKESIGTWTDDYKFYRAPDGVYQNIEILLREYLKAIPFDLAQTLETIFTTAYLEIIYKGSAYHKYTTIPYDKYRTAFGDLNSWTSLQETGTEGKGTKNFIGVKAQDDAYNLSINFDVNIMTIIANTNIYYYQIPKEQIDGIVNVIMEGSELKR